MQNTKETRINGKAFYVLGWKDSILKKYFLCNFNKNSTRFFFFFWYELLIKLNGKNKPAKYPGKPLKDKEYRSGRG